MSLRPMKLPALGTLGSGAGLTESAAGFGL